MQLTVMSDQPVLFETGENHDARLIPSAGTSRAVLVLDPAESSPQWISPGQAMKDAFAVLEATKEELAGLRAAGYRLPVIGRRGGK